MLKHFDSEYDIMFPDPLMSWECRETSLMMRVQPNHWDNMLWTSSLNGSNEDLYIQPRALELYVKARMCYPGTSCCMESYIDVGDERNSRKFSVRTPWKYDGMYQRHTIPLSL